MTASVPSGRHQPATPPTPSDTRERTLDVVFLHGWLMGPDLWDSQVAALDGIANTHALAAPAHGTPAPPEGFTMAAWADLVMDQLDLRSVERAVFVGHSMSGYLTQQIWRDHPHRVAALGLVGTTWQYALVNEKEAFAELIGNIARDWRTHAPRAAQLLVGSDYLASNPRWLDRWTDHIERNYDLTGMARLIAAINERPDYAPTNRQIDVPTTVIYSTEDRVFSVDVGRNLAAQIPGAEPVEIEGAGHAIPMERPEPVAAAVRALVEKAT